MEFISYLHIMCAFGVAPLAYMIDHRHLDNPEDVAFIVFYFAAVGISVVNPSKEPSNSTLWMIAFLYPLFAILGLCTIYNKAKKES